MRRPNFFLVGAPKCGTTSMYSYLGAHPDAFMPRIKEPNFFADDLKIRSYPEVDSLEAYLSLYESSSGQKILGDASQFHLYSKTAASRIKSFAPDSRVAILLREPVSMMRSLHAQYLKTLDEEVLDFGDAVALDAERRSGRSVPERTLFPRCMAYVDVATFSPQVERYFNSFGRDAVCVILLDDLRRDTEATYAGLLDFLGVDSSFTPDFQPRNASSTEAGFDPTLEGRLREIFAPEVDRLELLLRRDLSGWKRSSL